MTIQTAVLIETLAALGATVRWCSCNIFSTQDHAAAAVAVGPQGHDRQCRKGVPVFAWKGETLEEYWWCTERALDFGDGRGPNQIVDDGGDATLLIHKGVEFEKAGKVPAPDTTDNEEFKVILKLLAKTLSRTARALDQSRRRRCRASARRPPPACIASTKCRRPARCSSRPSTSTTASPRASSTISTAAAIPWWTALMRATDVMLSGKVAVVCGYGDVGKGCCQSLRGQGAASSSPRSIPSAPAGRDGRVIRS